MDNKEQKIDPNLEKLLKVFNGDKILTKDDIDQVLEGIVSIIEKFKKSTDTLNGEIKDRLEKTLQQIAEQHNGVLSEMKGITAGAKTETVTEAKTHIKKSSTQITKLIKDFKAIRPKDGEPGKDADVQVAITEVLKQIKLPEYKEFILNGADIVDQINELDTSEENQIDAKHIKNLPKPPKPSGTGGAGIKGVTAGTNISVDTNPYFPTVTLNIPVQPTAPSNPVLNQLWIDNS